MYRLIIRPLLFLLPPEKVHELIVLAIRVFFRIPLVPSIIRGIFSYPKPALEKEVFGLRFKNPVGLAAGFDKNALFYKEFRHFGFGFIEIGTVTPRPQPGNLKPRSFRLPADRALINRMGFNNLGVEQAVERLKSRPDGYIIGGNIGKNTSTPNSEAAADYEYCFKALYDYVDYFVVNVSCPNISDLTKLQDQDMLMAILGRIMHLRSEKPQKKPVLLKISPDLNYHQVDETLEIVKKLGLQGIVATNTSVSREGLKSPLKRIEAIGNGGLSGAPISARSTEIIRYIREKAGPALPIIATGGVMSIADAREKISAGADLIQVYTGFIYEGPGFVKQLLKGVERWEGEQ
jgi:dihydroorotate dehydrogenase